MMAWYMQKLKSVDISYTLDNGKSGHVAGLSDYADAVRWFQETENVVDYIVHMHFRAECLDDPRSILFTKLNIQRKEGE